MDTYRVKRKRRKHKMTEKHTVCPKMRRVPEGRDCIIINYNKKYLPYNTKEMI